jgi:hypothetical protein
MLTLMLFIVNINLFFFRYMRLIRLEFCFYFICSLNFEFVTMAKITCY